MKSRDFKKGVRNIFYSFKATSFRNRGFPKILPRTVWVGTTYLCNSKCKMCDIWKRYRKNPEEFKQEMTFDEFKRFVDKNSFLRDIALSGGEPYLNKHLENMWIYLDKRGYSTGTATNAVLGDKIISFEENISKKLTGKNPHGLEVSIDGLGKEHDRVRGIPGLFSKAVKIVKWGVEQQKKDPNFSIVVSHTITSNNYKQLLDFIDYFVSLGVRPNQISFRTAQVSSSFYGNQDSKEIPTENKEIIYEIQKVMKKYSYFREDWFYRNMIKFLKNPNEFRIPCYAGMTFAYIDPYWNVYPCITLSTKMGNLREFNFDLKKLWYSKKAVAVRKLVKKNQCPNCWTGCSTIPSRVSNYSLLLSHYFKTAFK